MKPEQENKKRGYHILDRDTLERCGLQLAQYQGNRRDGSSDGVVAYKVFKDEKVVVYSGLNDAGLSSINAAERIIASLVEEDPFIDQNEFKFFDVQTKRGYEYMNEGDFDITEIKLNADGTAHFVPRVKLSQLPEAFRPVLPILSNP